jgi:uncharacterized cofD-like protein
VIRDKVTEIAGISLSPLDLLPQVELREKIVALALQGVPENAHATARVHLEELRRQLLATEVNGVRVVVFGGGTGLSNIIGGDSRLPSWAQKPFSGLKEIFPQTSSVVCFTDDGGSTGELLKDLPLVAIGDMRHVLLASIQLARLQKKYTLTAQEATSTAALLADIFNWRYRGPLSRSHPGFSAISSKIRLLPASLGNYLLFLLDHLFSDPRLATTLSRPHCLGNLILVAAIYRETEPGHDNERLAGQQELLHPAVEKGMSTLGRVLGAGSVLPGTSTPAQLRVRYTNGVECAGEHRLSLSQRGFPVESVGVDYFDEVRLYDTVLADIAAADILVFAPGSLYSSVIPIFKVPGLADAVRQNRRALKILVSNLWVQSGETDLSLADPERKFYVSDMIRAYEKNIPGGTRELFNEVICISLQDIPASILQRYAVEGKVPIYLDRKELVRRGNLAIECGVYSRTALAERGVIQHDPDTLAMAIKALYSARDCLPAAAMAEPADRNAEATVSRKELLPCRRYGEILHRVEALRISSPDEAALRRRLVEILWDHPIIPLAHLDYCQGIQSIAREDWRRDQQWDNVFSFYDPEDCCIKIRRDQLERGKRLEIAFLIALGESLLGNYAADKQMREVIVDGLGLGRVYHLHLREEGRRTCYFQGAELRAFLSLARMCATADDHHYTRLVNSGEGFTPPGLLMGLMYAWYLDNRFATHIEYKMSVTRISQTDLIPEQQKMVARRKKMVDFFRDVVFRSR